MERSNLFVACTPLYEIASLCSQWRYNCHCEWNEAICLLRVLLFMGLLHYVRNDGSIVIASGTKQSVCCVYSSLWDCFTMFVMTVQLSLRVERSNLFVACAPLYEIASLCSQWRFNCHCEWNEAICLLRVLLFMRLLHYVRNDGSIVIASGTKQSG